MRAVRDGRGLSGLLLALALACAESPLVAPPRESPKPPAFPQVPAGSVLYVRSDSSAEGLVLSRYVLHADSTLSLQFSSVRSGVVAYPGKYHRTDSLIALDFRDPTTLGRWEWEAVGTLRGDSLHVAYNTVMAFDDFVNGVYVRDHRQ